MSNGVLEILSFFAKSRKKFSTVAVRGLDLPKQILVEPQTTQPNFALAKPSQLLNF